MHIAHISSSASALRSNERSKRSCLSILLTSLFLLSALPRHPGGTGIIRPGHCQIIHEEHPLLPTHESLNLQPAQIPKGLRKHHVLQRTARGARARRDGRILGVRSNLIM